MVQAIATTGARFYLLQALDRQYIFIHIKISQDI